MGFVHKIIAAAREVATETFWPQRCAGCNLPGEPLCPDCRSKLPLIRLETACPRCGAPFGSVACTECPPPGSTNREGRLLPPPFAFSAARAACSYEGVAKRVVTIYKDEDDAQLAPEIAGCIAAVAGDWAGWADAVAAIPASPASLRRRGYDHMEPVAQAVARQLELPLIHPLRSRKAADQRLLGSLQRAQNRAGSFALAEDDPLPRRILLVDDVLTTGATTSAAAKALLDGGACEVRVAVFARVW